MLPHNLKFKLAHLEVSTATFQKRILLGDHPDVFLGISHQSKTDVLIQNDGRK